MLTNLSRRGATLGSFLVPFVSSTFFASRSFYAFPTRPPILTPAPAASRLRAVLVGELHAIPTPPPGYTVRREAMMINARGGSAYNRTGYLYKVHPARKHLLPSSSSDANSYSLSEIVVLCSSIIPVRLQLLWSGLPADFLGQLHVVAYLGQCCK